MAAHIIGLKALNLRRIAIDSVFVIGLFSSFVSFDILLTTFFSPFLYGVYSNSDASMIASLIMVLTGGFAATSGSLLYWERHGRNLFELLILVSISFLVIDFLFIPSGPLFPMFEQDLSYVFLLIFATSLGGIVYGLHGLAKARESVAVAPGRLVANKIVVWSIVIASIAGLFGVVALDLPLFGLYTLPPSPLLGQPFGFQTLLPCNVRPFVVCVPTVENNVAIAVTDFMVCFGVGFLIAYALQNALKVSASSTTLKRNAMPLVLLLITSLFVSFTAAGSINSGASFSQPHWSTIVTIQLANMTLYSGSGTSPSSQGSAHIDLIIENYHWTGENISISVSLTGPNATGSQTIYTCQTVNSCKAVSFVILKPYSTAYLNTTTTAFYLGSAIEKGARYSYMISLTSDLNSISSWDNITAR